jgi:hypothetical protein
VKMFSRQCPTKYRKSPTKAFMELLGVWTNSWNCSACGLTHEMESPLTFQYSKKNDVAAANIWGLTRKDWPFACDQESLHIGRSVREFVVDEKFSILFSRDLWDSLW